MTRNREPKAIVGGIKIKYFQGIQIRQVRQWVARFMNPLNFFAAAGAINRPARDTLANIFVRHAWGPLGRRSLARQPLGRKAAAPLQIFGDSQKFE
jgi:hypothetical protein